MICPNCGAENDDNSKICSLCGIEFETEVAESDLTQYEKTEKEPVKNKNSSVKVIIILLIAVVVILAGFLIYLSFFDDNNKSKNTSVISTTIETTTEPQLSAEATTETAIKTTTAATTTQAVTTESEKTTEKAPKQPSEKNDTQKKKQYNITELKSMTGKEIAELCGDKYSSVISQYSGYAYEFTSPSVLPGYRIYFEYDNGDKYVPDDKLPTMIYLDYGNATESTWFGMTYSEFIENNGVPDYIYWDNMDGGGFNIVYTDNNVDIHYKFQTDSDVFDYLSGLTGEYYEFKVDDQINSYLIEQDPCVNEIWCK